MVMTLLYGSGLLGAMDRYFSHRIAGNTELLGDLPR